MEGRVPGRRVSLNLEEIKHMACEAVLQAPLLSPDKHPFYSDDLQ